MPDHTDQFLPAPGWALALGNVGSILVWAGLAFFLSSIILWITSPSAVARERLAKWSFSLGCFAIFGAFLSLAVLFVTDQFQFEYVEAHSVSNLALKYKVAAVWSGQQGSFLLWATTSAVFGLLAIRGTGSYRRWYTVAYAAFLGSLCGILAYETPFRVIKDAILDGVVRVPIDGSGLNPSLQNYWVVIHPPTIFLGFGSLTVMFAYGIAAMLSGDIRDWAGRVRPWALTSLAVLGLGLVMGGFWAYETLGWGGFWAWDPVENVSFVPWIFTAAFVHGIIVQTTRGRWFGANLLMTGLPFILFVYGTFLTRSGYLSKFSVHSFAEMNGSALWILFTFMTAAAVTYVVLWAVRGRSLAKAFEGETKAEGFTRESAYQTGVLLLTGLATTVAIGMSIPFFLGLLNKDAKVVEEPLYHSVVVWFFIPIMLLIAAAPFISWRKMGAAEFWNRFVTVIGVTFFVSGVAVLLFKFSDWSMHADLDAKLDFPFGIHVNRFWWTITLLMVSTLAAVANVWRLLETFKRSKMGIGGFLSHLGLAVAMAGLILSRGLESKSQILVMDGSPGQGLGYQISYKGMTSNPQTDRDNKVLFDVRPTTGLNAASFEARPGFFFTPGAEGAPSAFTWPHIEHQLTHDVYVSLASPRFTLWDKPITLKPGESHRQDGLEITYVEPTTHGTPGTEGAAFGAKLKIVEEGKSYFAEPKITVGEGPNLAHATPTFYATLMGMNAADRSIQLQLPFTKILYPIELFYKPMTLLVWVGTGILTFGGLLSALYRRPRRRKEADASPAVELNVEQVEDASVATA